MIKVKLEKDGFLLMILTHIFSFFLYTIKKLDYLPPVIMLIEDMTTMGNYKFSYLLIFFKPFF